MSRFFTRLVAVPLAATALLSFATPSGIAANELSSVVAGASGQANANVSPAKPEPNGRIARQDLEVIETAGRNIPDPLTPQRIESFLNETITTTQTGHLLVTKSMELTTTCIRRAALFTFSSSTTSQSGTVRCSPERGSRDRCQA